MRGKYLSCNEQGLIVNYALSAMLIMIAVMQTLCIKETMGYEMCCCMSQEKDVLHWIYIFTSAK